MMSLTHLDLRMIELLKRTDVLVEIRQLRLQYLQRNVVDTSFQVFLNGSNHFIDMDVDVAPPEHLLLALVYIS